MIDSWTIINFVCVICMGLCVYVCVLERERELLNAVKDSLICTLLTKAHFQDLILMLK